MTLVPSIRLCEPTAEVVGAVRQAGACVLDTPLTLAASFACIPAGYCLAYYAADNVPSAQFRVAALINDSVGTLAGGCYVDADTKIGVILGTGTNACYVEHSSAIAALTRNNGHGQRRPHMAINTEWGNYDASSTPYTDVRRASYALAWGLCPCIVEAQC